MSLLERPGVRGAGFADFARDAALPFALNGLAAFVFSCTGPVAIMIAVATGAGLGQADIASWLFGGFGLGGLITIAFSLRYRQPLSFAWTIPGIVLLGAALEHLSFAEALGAYLLTGVLITALGLSGLARRAMALVPMPIVMGMVAGVFLDFVLRLVGAFAEEFWIAASMVATYAAVAAIRGAERYLPPVVAALVAGAAVAGLGGSLAPPGPAPPLLTVPTLYVPEFSLQAALELVVPLAITVLAVQNAQGFAILDAAGHRPPVNAMTTACGLGSLVFAAVGCVSTCVTGPANAVLASYGEHSRQYTAGVVYGVLGVLFGVFAATMTWLALALPVAYIATLGGLGVLRVLQSAFVTAFKAEFSLGALVTFTVTVSGLTLYNVGAPFWGLVFGLAASALLEREHFQRARAARACSDRDPTSHHP